MSSESHWKLSAFADEIDPDLDVQFTELKAQGIQLVDFRSAFGKNVMDLTNREIELYQQALGRYGLIINCVASPVNKVKASEVTADTELNKLARAIEVARKCGCRRIRIFSPETGSAEVALEWMKPQVELAKEHDVVLMHENDARYFGAYPEQASVLLGELAGPNFRFAFDFANTVQIGFHAMTDWFPWLLPHLETIHIKDANGKGQVVPAGEGDGQLVATLTYLKEQGWEGILSIEPHLQYAGDRGGFSGIESFNIATLAIKNILKNL